MPSSGYRRPLDAAALAHNFRVFAEAECAGEPLYAALSRGIAERPEVLALLMRAPYPQRRPVLLFAATHDLLLSGRSHPVARFYRSCVPEAASRVDVDEAIDPFADFCRTGHDALVARMAGRTVQTNEVGRSAGLRLALATLGARTPIALIDVGCSAGLNLLVDRYRFEFRLRDGSLRTAGPASTVVVGPSSIGTDPPMTPIATIDRRFGIDLAPLDVNDERDARWLQACVWPSDGDRHARLSAAMALARTTPLDLRRGDANEHLPIVLEAVGPGVRPVVFHSWVASYFDRDTRRRFADTARAMVVARDGAWISAEGPDVVPGLAAPPLEAGADAARREATVWHVTTRERGAAVTRAVARSHPHCRWIEWF